MFVTTAYALSATAVQGDTASTPATAPTKSGTVVKAEVEHEAFPPFDPSSFPSQLLWLAITFGAFYFAVAKFITPRLSGILATRESRITADLAEAKRMKDEADAAIQKYQHELADARAKSNAIATEARDSEKAKAEAERAKLEADLAGKIADAEKSIAVIRDKALAEVESVAGETASAIVEQLTGLSVNASDAASAVKAIKG